MTNSKYQICTKEGVYNFEDKDSFKRQGQIMFNDYSRNKNKTETYFSCDHGRSWIFIVNFGKEKISNFKCLSDKIYEYPFGKSYSKINNTTNTNKSNPNNSFIYIILIIAVGVFFFVKSQENKSSSQTNTINSSTNTDAVGQSTEDSKSSDPQIESNASEEQVDNSVSEPQNNEDNGYDNNSQSNERSSSNNYQQENNQPVKRKCYRCNGTGDCPKCSVPQNVRYKKGESPNDHKEVRLGMIVCNQCGGNTMNWGHEENKSCYVCKATGWLYCPTCNVYGNGRNIGKCGECNGTGFQR